MENSFREKSLPNEEFNRGLSHGIGAGDIVPVMSCSAMTGDGVEDALANL